MHRRTIEASFRQGPHTCTHSHPAQGSLRTMLALPPLQGRRRTTPAAMDSKAVCSTTPVHSLERPS